MRKNKIILLMLLFIGINIVLIQNVDASTSKSTYTIVYNSNGGNGKQVTQQCKRNKYVNLIGNTYKKEGYVFSGWTVNKNGTGKMYKNKARVKNLTSGNKIILYAKWTDKKIKDMTPVLQAVIEGNYRDNGWKYKFDNESLWGSIYNFAFHFCHTKIPGMKFKEMNYMEYAILDEKLVEDVCSAISVKFSKLPEIEKDYRDNIKYDKKEKSILLMSLQIVVRDMI